MEKMKRKSMKLAIILVAAALITSCFVGGTFAKYTTSGTRREAAIVAKFGVTINSVGSMFSTSYENENGARTVSKSVLSTASVVAPGTSGKMSTVAISGTPEVAVEVKFTAELALTNWQDETGAYYCPIEITVGETTIKGNDFSEVSEFEAKVKEEIESYSAQYEAGSSLTNTVNIPEISWAWAFEGDDEKDTYLGSNSATEFISLDITTNVSQIL